MEAAATRLDAPEIESEDEDVEGPSDGTPGYFQEGTEAFLEDAKLRLAALRIRLGADARLSRLQGTLSSFFQEPKSPSRSSRSERVGILSGGVEEMITEFESNKDHFERLSRAMNKCVARNRLLAEAERELGQVLVEYGKKEGSEYFKAIESFGQAHLFVSAKRLDLVATNEQRTLRPLVMHLRTAVEDAATDVDSYLSVQQELSILRQAISEREKKSKTSFTDAIEKDAAEILHNLESVEHKKMEIVSSKLKMLRSKAEVDYVGLMSSYMCVLESFEKLAVAELSSCEKGVLFLQEHVKHRSSLVDL